MKKILVTPDGFKGSLTAVKFCQLAEEALSSLEGYEVILRPMSDGGEGFVEALTYAGLAQVQQVGVTDPLGRKVMAQWGWQADSKTAIIEMAQASGLPLLKPGELDPIKASSFGTGQVIEAAIQQGAQKIILGLGGSATNDGGAGALQALGFDLINQKGQALPLGGGSLIDLAEIVENRPGLGDSLAKIDWVLACDVINPLLGEQGATAVFGPQKGVTAQNYAVLEAGLMQWAQVIERTFGREVVSLEGAGAAGGMAAGFYGVLGARIVPGFEVLSGLLKLESLFVENKIDYVITGEGCIDLQTQQGKLPYRMAQLAQEYQVPVLGVCGQLATDINVLPVFDALKCIHTLQESKEKLSKLIGQTPEHLKRTIVNYFGA